jgi:hypothetical protein
MSEKTIDAEQVEREHLAEVGAGVQAAYLFGVLLIGTLLMLGLIAFLAR